MGSSGSRRLSTWLRSAGALLVALLAAPLLCSAAGASAQPLPSPMPGGYSLEREGAVRWIYPTAAQTEVAQLKPVLRETWTQLGRSLGAQLSPALDLRVAVNPAQMQALAPAGRRLPSYASGVAFPEDGVILLSMTEPGSWLRPNLRRLLVHELSHVALQRAVGSRPVPRWFSEGLAIHQAREHSLDRIKVLWEATLRDDLIPLASLSTRFPERHGDVDIAYAEAADLVEHLLDGRSGPVHFRALIAELGTGRSFESAFAAAYGMPLPQLEQSWRASMGQRFGPGPSILGGLTLVWIVGALLLVVGYVKVRRRHRKTLERWAIEEAPLAAETPPPAPPAARHAADDVLDSWGDQRRRDSGVPTIVHDGRSHTLH